MINELLMVGIKWELLYSKHVFKGICEKNVLGFRNNINLFKYQTALIIV